MEFHEILGNQIAKRAIEISLVGGHTVTFIGSPDSGKSLLRHFTPQNLTSWELRPCHCGYLSNPKRACHCTLREILKWQRLKRNEKALNADMVIETTGHTDAHRQKDNEHFDQVGIRVHAARGRQMVTELDPEALRLLSMAIKELRLTPRQRVNIIKVSGSIARLDGTTTKLRAEHIAEAIQYQHRSIG